MRRNPSRFAMRSDGSLSGAIDARTADTQSSSSAHWIRWVAHSSPYPCRRWRGVDLVADLDDPVGVGRGVEADPADHHRLGTGDRGADQPPVVVAGADLIPSEAEHVAALGGPFRRVARPRHARGMLAGRS